MSMIAFAPIKAKPASIAFTGSRLKDSLATASFVASSFAKA